MDPWSFEVQGRIDEHVFTSEALRGNALGDSTDGRSGSTSRRATTTNRTTVPERLHDPGPDRPARHVAQPGAVPPELPRARRRAVRRGRCAALPSWSGSTAGRHSAAASSSTPPAPATTTRTSATRSSRASTRTTGRSPTATTAASPGKSSGGYGAMVTPMLRPDLFGGLPRTPATRCSRCATCPEFRESVRALRDDYDGSFEQFWEDFRSRPAFSKDSDGTC